MNKQLPSSGDDNVLEAVRLGRTAAETQAWLFQDLSLTIAAGERIALVGPSGSGKTVLLRSLALLDPLEQGTLLWHGQQIARDEVPRFRSKVLYLHQRPALIEGTVEDNLRFPFQFVVHKKRQFDPQLIRHYLERLGRDASFLNKRSHNLSGGELQITALLRAIQLEPEVLLLDEPTAALDQAAAEAVETCVLQWQRERDKQRCLVVVSHNADQVNRMVHRTVSIRDGVLSTTQDVTQAQR